MDDINANPLGYPMKVNDRVTFSGEIPGEYVSVGTYIVEDVNTQGVYFRNPETGGGTRIQHAILARFASHYTVTEA